MKNLKKYQLVIFLVLIVIGMVVVKIKYGYQDNESNDTILPPTPTIYPTIKINQEEQDYSLWNKLPYTGTGFVIEKYVDKKTLLVKIKGVDKKIALSGITEWLTSNKVDPKEYKIVFE